MLQNTTWLCFQPNKTTIVGNISREICTKMNIKMKSLKLESTYKMITVSGHKHMYVTCEYAMLA